MSKATVAVRAIKVTVPLQPEDLPREGVPMDGPIGDVEWSIALEGGALQLAARFNGKNYRRMLKTIDANGANVSVVLQGTLKAAAVGQPLVLDSAGFQVIVKSPKPEAAPAAAAPSSEPVAPVAAATAVVEPIRAAPVAAAKEVAPEKPPAASVPLPGTALPGRRSTCRRRR